MEELSKYDATPRIHYFKNVKNFMFINSTNISLSYKHVQIHSHTHTKHTDTHTHTCTHLHIWTSLMIQWVKNPPSTKETQVWSLGWEDPLRRKRQPTPVLSPRKSHGQRSLVVYIPQDRKELDMTEHDARPRHAYINTHIHIYMCIYTDLCVFVVISISAIKCKEIS